MFASVRREYGISDITSIICIVVVTYAQITLSDFITLSVVNGKIICRDPPPFLVCVSGSFPYQTYLVVFQERSIEKHFISPHLRHGVVRAPDKQKPHRIRASDDANTVNRFIR